MRRKWELFLYWRQAVDQALQSTYNLTIADAGISDEELQLRWQDRDEPQEYVDWFGEHYDLIPVSEVRP